MQLQLKMERTFGEEETCFAQDAEEDEGVQTDTVVSVSVGDMVDTARDLPRLPIPTGSTMEESRPITLTQPKAGGGMCRQRNTLRLAET